QAGRCRAEDLHTVCIRSASLLRIRELRCWVAGAKARRGEVVMRRRIGLLVSLVALLALGGGMLAATPAWATPPQHFHHLALNFSFRDDVLSDACGFDVFEVG